MSKPRTAIAAVSKLLRGMREFEDNGNRATARGFVELLQSYGYAIVKVQMEGCGGCPGEVYLAPATEVPTRAGKV